MTRPQTIEYLVKTVGELDTLVNKKLVTLGAAEKPALGESTYKITDREKAKSSFVMPKVLNPLGKKGWNLKAVNKMECYIFAKGEPVEYKVLTPVDIDKISIEQLQKTGAMKLTGFEGDAPRLEITQPQEATIQKVLPQVLASLNNENWELCAINGPQLYFFSRTL